MTYRVGIVGSSFGGAVHAPAFALHPAFEVVAIASPRNAATVARERKIPHAFDSLDAMLAGVELDVISVSTPPFDHHGAVLAALRAGKHVLCEKPFALNVAQAEELVAAERAAGTACAIVHEFRYCPAPASLRAALTDGRVTSLREIEITNFGSELRAASLRPRSGISQPPPQGGSAAKGGWWFSRALGGGVANSVMPHVVDLSNWLAGRAPLATHGFGRTANAQRQDAEGIFTSDVFDGVYATLDYGDGLVARLTVDRTVSMTSTTAALHAEDISLVANGEFFTDMRMFAIEPDEQSEFELAPSRYATTASVGPNIPAFLCLLDDFALRLASGGGEAPTFAEGLAVQRVLAAVGYSTP